MLTMLAAIAVLLVLSAFFSGSETALTGASRPLMHLLETKGNKRAETVNKLQERKGRLIGAILIGNNLVNILASALATSILIGMFGEAGIAYATVIMTALVVMFAEILPKTYALQNSDRAALRIAPIIRPLVFVLSPITFATQWVVRITLRIFGIHLHSGEDFVSKTDELRGAIELHQSEEDDNETVQHERAMLRSVLDLSEVDVGEIMVHRKTVTMINADEPAEEIVNQVLASQYTRLPLWRDQPDNVIGVLHAKEVLRAIHENQGSFDIDIEGLAAEAWFIPETTRLLDQLQAFRDRHEHFALVVDEYGSLEGVVTLEDILEEIVGDIADETDISVPGLRPQPDGSYIVDGSFTIRDLNRQFEWNLPDEEASTIAGLILHESRRIPEVGQAFMFYGLRFDIMRRQRHQITAIRLTPPQSTEKGAS
ncbi:MAG: HlyC/CorC family transporter [Rhodospirillaceae bacterium]|jgi:Mg2+/Co2+ transporter CorB|nr:HlyC/CorC family transporter [Rhodospirillaceae bacterium]MBT4590166.1 HlyC/CorC family transporter [Rhodospirillaceae bacterium]MBT4940122.1 HlyC/CorC family transporter [Rhodospirillaceae bacterium]MBT5942020.1 HlyC/CorC family transporter [Rhodospirillaceae bacterium]MBT7269166.1 HlyC/CorC family transporter [Rhodospirillaceae bacterium]